MILFFWFMQLGVFGESRQDIFRTQTGAFLGFSIVVFSTPFGAIFNTFGILKKDGEQLKDNKYAKINIVMSVIGFVAAIISVVVMIFMGMSPFEIQWGG